MVWMYLTRISRSLGVGAIRHLAWPKRAWPKRAWLILVWQGLLLGQFMVAPAARADIDAATVERAIDRGIAYLRKTQTQRGSWDEFPNQSCGASALSTLALLNAGVPHDDPAITRAMRYLRSIVPTETYSVALQTLVYCQLGAAGDIPLIRRNVQTMVQLQNTQGNSDPSRLGGWGYGGGRVSSGDPSNSQFALLALGAAHDRGIEIDAEVFRLSIEYWTRRQRPSGGWSYLSQQPSPSGSMTAAGIASLLIARGRVQLEASPLSGDELICCGDDQASEDAIAAALDWMGKHFSIELNPGGQSYTYYYYLYALERVGRLTGRRFIGDHDWYREGAERLVALQDQFEGFWAGSNWEEDRNVSTSFALLFLSKGKRQVVVGQLSHGDQVAARPGAAGVKPEHDSPHPDGLRQMVRHVEQAWGRDLTWQTIDVERASLQDLLQAPVIVIQGDSALTFTAGQTDRLKQYLDQGGTLLFEALGGDGCGDASAFEQSVNRLCDQWFPGSKLERLPPSHPVWFAEKKIDPAKIERLGEDFWVYGVQACCRTAVFYVPRSLACRWELGGGLFRRSDQSSPVRDQVEVAVRLGQNVIAYATGRELKDKLDQPTILEGSELASSTRGVVQMAMLALDAGGVDANRALTNVASIIRQSRPVMLSAEPDPIGFDSQQLQFLPVLWIHGRTDFSLNESQRRTLREFIAGNGIIFGTAICGSQPFADAFRREFAAILPQSGLTPLPPEHPLLSRAFGGYDIATIDIRKPTETGQGLRLSRHPGRPQIEVAQVDGFASVFFSPLDVSCALESPNSVQCHGYDTADAAKIVTNVLLFALQQ